MALLDTDGVYGAPRFHLAADKAKIKAHIGAEVTCSSLESVILSGASAKRSEALALSKDPYLLNIIRGLTRHFRIYSDGQPMPWSHRNALNP